MIIAIDFDGTIVEDRFPQIGELRPGAVEAIQYFRQRGFYLILWTCRTDKRLAEAAQFCGENGLHFDAYNSSCPSNIDKFSGNDTRKVYADLYIDDKTHAPLPSWPELVELINVRFPSYADEVIREGYL